ncbi:hypothetical protein A5679_03205 [Mycobacterium scrofulaceum]|uniref:Uncharacterized protein n=1 Tax=Mycobacterium scrofulaceum TaxID=1783 RepID=A0A1A2UAU0_MYCSC|nr:hypothetical protein A5679_03205 [Mycobacterium scrofulaceum]
MNSNTIWIVVAVIAAVLVIAALLFAVSRSRSRRRQRQAQEIREQAKLETAKVERREALAQETAAKARAAQAEAEAKAAEAARLQERAANHQNEVAASREQLQEQLKRADELHPEGDAKPTDQRDDPDAAWSSEPHDPTTPGEAVRHETYRGTP